MLWLGRTPCTPCNGYLNRLGCLCTKDMHFRSRQVHTTKTRCSQVTKGMCKTICRYTNMKNVPFFLLAKYLNFCLRSHVRKRATNNLNQVTATTTYFQGNMKTCVSCFLFYNLKVVLKQSFSCPQMASISLSSISV